MRPLGSGLGAVAAAIAAALPVSAQPFDVEPYLLDEEVEIGLARSAAPSSVSAEATVLVLRRDGYRDVARGANGFTCLVERSWSSPFGPHEDFFNPSLRAPICYSAGATRAALEEYLRRTELALAGYGWSEIRDRVAADIAAGRLVAPQGLAMSYMMSSDQLLGTATGRFLPHLMFYIPYATGEQLGAQPDNPHAMMFEYEGGPFAALIVPVAAWADSSETGVGRAGGG